LFGAPDQFITGDMHFDQSPYFNMTVDACRRAGSVGGRRSGRNRRFRKANVLSVPDVNSPEVPTETARQAIERIDAACPWLVGCERRATRCL
jgi:hypothetical protein